MRLPVAEVFASVQGEGLLSGTPAIFIRLAGCTYASGGSDCGGPDGWCDTDHRPTVHVEPVALSEMAKSLAVEKSWPMDSDRFGFEKRPLVVLTGGEPCLHLGTPAGEVLLGELSRWATIAVETSGADLRQFRRDLVHHLCLSPKPLHGDYDSGSVLSMIRFLWPNEVKILVPDSGEVHVALARFLWSIGYAGPVLFQPVRYRDDPTRTQAALESALRASWSVGARLSAQVHVLLGLR